MNYLIVVRMYKIYVISFKRISFISRGNMYEMIIEIHMYKIVERDFAKQNLALKW